ncbi:Binding partner of ACD11 1 [Camellia lanceoleosa]|uniref:Binding partner of ACD11 1 n=1 Tax=Camellia lanceoleosa TaxID=1840588 RepID=A0ACC0I7A5_9ERIC|nr:Binding partner of ACD11 1 [Camellia lanceoleosa]
MEEVLNKQSSRKPSSILFSDEEQMIIKVPMDHTNSKIGIDVPPSSTPNWTINVSDVRTVKVSNISLATSEKDIKEFFSFSGDIQYVEMQRETETSQLAYVTFKESQGADTAMLLTGSTIADFSVSITRVENYQLPPDAPPLTPKETNSSPSGSAVEKAEDVVSTMLAKGFILGKGTLNKAKSFDEQHHLTANASATVASIDRKMGFTEKISIGTAVVNEKVREMDEKFQVTEKTKSAFAAAEQKASSAGTAIMSNPYVSTGASWFSNAFSVVTKAAEDVSTMTKEKVEKAEEEKKEIIFKDREAIVNDFARVHLDEPLAGEQLAVVIAKSADDNNPATI